MSFVWTLRVTQPNLRAGNRMKQWSFSQPTQVTSKHTSPLPLAELPFDSTFQCTAFTALPSAGAQPTSLPTSLPTTLSTPPRQTASATTGKALQNASDSGLPPRRSPPAPNTSPRTVETRGCSAGSQRPVPGPTANAPWLLTLVHFSKRSKCQDSPGFSRAPLAFSLCTKPRLFRLWSQKAKHGIIFASLKPAMFEVWSIFKGCA